MNTTSFPSPEVISKSRILVVGDVMLDRYWFGAVERISPEAPVPVVKVTGEQDRLGGAANVALNIKMLGGRVTLLSMVGQDEAATCLQSLLRSNGVDAVLGQDPSLTTIVKLRVIGRQQQLLRVDFERETKHEVLAKMIDDFEREAPNHDVVIFSDYGKGGLAHISAMIEIARDAGKAILVDPKGKDYTPYKGATLITPNKAELTQVIGAWSSEIELEKMAEALRAQLEIEHLLLTRSEEGMSLFSKNGSKNIPAQVREVSDVTGAGDTVIATLATMLACGLSAEEAMIHANRAAGMVVAKFGTASVSYEELQP
jgi:rfaE bifunctional protein kinase chain/domain